jgi:cytoskeletal protein RodZ
MNSGTSSLIQDNVMETLGEFFQRARERQGLSLDQIAAQTRIQERHLQALEEEDFASLPAKVFTKGFVRSYARSLGLDEDEAIQLFLTSSNSFYEQTQQEEQHVQIKIEAAHRSRFNWNLVLILFLVMGALLFYLLPEQQENLPSTPESEAPMPIESTQEPPPSLGEPPASVSSLDPVDTVAPSAAPPSAAVPSPPIPEPEPPPIRPNVSLPAVHEEPRGSGGPLGLEIEATQLTWVVVQSDDEAPHEALLQPGQRIIWKAKKKYLLTLGNAAGVVIRLNGETKGPFGKPGQVVRDILLKP